MKKVVLGKGLDALIPSHSATATIDKKYRMVSLDRIEPNPMQPRREFGAESLRELAESLKQNGMMQPLVVMNNGSGFTIIAGERRFRAARLAGLDEVAVVIMDNVDEDKMLELALVENIQREDLNPIETAEAYRSLIDRCNLSQNELAERVGKSRTAVTNTMRLLGLPDSIIKMVRSGELSEGHARTLLAFETEEQMLLMVNRIHNESLSVRSLEQETSKSPRRRKMQRVKLPAILEVESNLKQILGTSVKIKHGPKKGRLEIEYYGESDLNRLLDLFQKIG
ncbi:MAG: ParB/RepB/Spo0J family partition protein [bacterium]